MIESWFRLNLISNCRDNAILRSRMAATVTAIGSCAIGGKSRPLLYHLHSHKMKPVLLRFSAAKHGEVLSFVNRIVAWYHIFMGQRTYSYQQVTSFDYDYRTGLLPRGNCAVIVTL